MNSEQRLEIRILYLHSSNLDAFTWVETYGMGGMHLCGSKLWKEKKGLINWRSQ